MVRRKVYELDGAVDDGHAAGEEVGLSERLGALGRGERGEPGEGDKRMLKVGKLLNCWGQFNGEALNIVIPGFGCDEGLEILLEPAFKEKGISINLEGDMGDINEVGESRGEGWQIVNYRPKESG